MSKVTEILDRYYDSNRIPERIKKRISLQDMKELADPLLEEIERLRAAIRDAPHYERCDLIVNRVYDSSTIYTPPKCNCWKRKALEEE
jgi:hypothetical protein